ncbi:MAG: hypothetical protein OHK0037_17930 [Elainellaceae cyanobacterium]
MRIQYTTNARAEREALEKLAPPPAVVWVNEFKSDAVKPFLEQFNRAVESSQPVVPVLIDSYGGEIDTLMAMVDICRSSPKPIATVVMGKAMSAGAILLSCGWHGYRYAAPNSRIMIHDCLTITFGKAGEIIADADEVKRLNALLYKILDENCQKPSGYFVDQVHHRSHADWYLTPEDALEHNLVNHVKIPTLQVNLSTTYEFLG